ncbi:ABC transporter permease [Clostridiaceae bacterium M8S5]|nr:ABC transporter permease [Clostridiaceae bacterium M8S5]
MIARFFRQSMMSFKALFGWLDPKIYILVKIVNPIFQLVFYCLLAGYAFKAKDIKPWVIGNSIILCTYNCIFGVGTVLSNDRRAGTLKLVTASPANNIYIFVSKAFMHVIDSFFTVAIGFIAGSIIFNISFAGVNFVLLALAIFIAMISATCFGLIISSLGLVTRDMNLIMNSVVMILKLLSGAIIPIAKLPSGLQKITYYMPLSRSIKAAKLIGNGVGEGVYSLIGQEIVVALIYALIGIIMFVITEKIAIDRGTLEAY